MKSILKQIIRQKKLELLRLKKDIPLKSLRCKALECAVKPRDFKKAIMVKGKVTLIGELKIASPSKGYLNKDLDLAKTAGIYQRCGIAAISVLTDRHFRGKLSDLKKVKKAADLPLLRKDFLIDEYQIYESRVNGADAVLLIAAILTKKKLEKMLAIAHALGMDAIIEVHTPDELKKVNMEQARIIGINNRDLDTFDVDLRNTEKLAKKIPRSKIIVSESGIFTRKDMLFLKKLKVDCALVGEGIVTAPRISRQIKALLGGKSEN